MSDNIHIPTIEETGGRFPCKNRDSIISFVDVGFDYEPCYLCQRCFKEFDNKRPKPPSFRKAKTTEDTEDTENK
jgi:hypothetical protein